MTESHLNLQLLEKVRKSVNKTTARCPACAAGGGDRSGNHLVIYPSGKFGCAAFPGDADHRRQVFAIAGVRGTNPEAHRSKSNWRLERVRERNAEQKKQRLMKTARLNRESIARHYEWGLADLWENSPQRIDCWKVESSPLHFLDSLFSPDDLVWTGKVHESGNTRYGRHWQTCRDWVSGCHKSVGPMVSPAVWNPGTISRSAANVLKAPYVVLDFDGFDGVKPESPLEVENHLRASGGIIRWLREHLDWNLAAILWTGSKSLHAWFQTPPPEVLNSLKQVAVELGLDPGLIGRPEHPCRLPGQIHEKTGQESKVLWLQTQEVNISGDFQTPPY